MEQAEEIVVFGQQVFIRHGAVRCEPKKLFMLKRRNANDWPYENVEGGKRSSNWHPIMNIRQSA